jgi:RimJ/RimL family protein N-acetyltransferase
MTSTTLNLDATAGLRLRRATVDDAADVVTFVGSAEDLRQLAPYEGYPLDEATVRHWIRERRAGFVLEEGGRGVAYGELVRDAHDEDLVWIGHMLVHPRRRGLGLGRSLVLGLMRVAEDRLNAREIAISAFADNVAALRCYLRSGFRERGTQRVGGRTLIELRHRVSRWRREPNRPIAGLLAMSALAVSVVFAPWELRSWLYDLGALRALGLSALAALAASGFAMLLWPMLPRRRAPLSHQLGLPVLYTVCIAVALGWFTLAMSAFLGLVGGSLSRQLWWSVGAESLQHGAVWGAVFLLGSRGLPALRRGGAP